jgi:DNA (cytosine-5)-methyltransferase 1
MKHQVLDLFSGIGGFSLGLERTGGFETAAFCEVDKKAQLVLKKHWPDVPIYDDVQELNAERLREDGINPTVICGGFPCQDISIAGQGEGIEGKQSGLWSEYARLIGEIRPQYAIVENVSALLVRGLDRVLGDLAEIGFDAEWHCIPASAVGAPHQRDRIWIVAHSMHQHKTQRGECPNAESEGDVGGVTSGGSQGDVERERSVRGPGSGPRQGMAYTHKRDQEKRGIPERMGGVMVKKNHIRLAKGTSQWAIEPRIPRVVNGFPGRLDRLKQLGNAVVPQIPEMIGNAILEFERNASTRGE